LQGKYIDGFEKVEGSFDFGIVYADDDLIEIFERELDGEMDDPE
jgi:hypothetical protein